MGTLPVLKSQEVIKILHTLGFAEVRQRGSHKLQEKLGEIIRRMDGRNIPTSVGGDFFLLVYLLPKIALSYIF